MPAMRLRSVGTKRHAPAPREGTPELFQRPALVRREIRVQLRAGRICREPGGDHGTGCSLQRIRHFQLRCRHAMNSLPAGIADPFRGTVLSPSSNEFPGCPLICMILRPFCCRNQATCGDTCAFRGKICGRDRRLKRLRAKESVTKLQYNPPDRGNAWPIHMA